MSAGVIGVYGGSFDPPHLGHVLAAAWALSHESIDHLLIVTTFEHAFGKQVSADFDDRCHMCELAFGIFARAKVSRIERELERPNRTLHTLQALRRHHPDASFRLLIGSDLLAETATWHRWDELVKLAPPLVVLRESYDVSDRDDVVIPNVNATEVRQALTAGNASVAAEVPDNVLAYIRERRLYREQP